MFKKIVILGDSFTYGHGCNDRVWHYSQQRGQMIGDFSVFKEGPSRFAWASLLAEEFPRVKVYNLAMPGLDNLGIMTNLLARPDIYKGVDLIIMSTTVPDRMLIRDTVPDQWTSSYGVGPATIDIDEVLKHGVVASGAHVDTDLIADENSRAAFEKYMAYCHHDGRTVQTAWSAVLSVWAVAKSQNANFVWAPPSYCAALRYKQAIPNSIGYKQMTNLHDFIMDKAECIAEDEHANELGHLTYYKQVVLPELKNLYYG